MPVARTRDGAQPLPPRANHAAPGTRQPRGCPASGGLSLRRRAVRPTRRGGPSAPGRRQHVLTAGHHTTSSEEIMTIRTLLTVAAAAFLLSACAQDGPGIRGMPGGDRKSVVSGKSVSGRVDLGGRRNIKKKTKQK